MAAGSVVALLLATLVVPGLATALGDRLAPGELLPGLDANPDPTDRLRYLGALLGVVVAAAVAWLLSTRGGEPAPATRRASAAVQVVAVALVAWCWIRQLALHPFLAPASLLLGALVAAAAVRWWRTRPVIPVRLRVFASRGGPRGREVGAGAVAVVATGWWLVPALHHGGNIAFAHPYVTYHLPFTMGEFAAVRNGLTPAVDFVPQYSNLLGLLVEPVFAAVGLGIGAYSAAMAVLSAVALLAVHRALRLAAGGPVGALALYLVVLAGSLLPLVVDGRERVTIANLHQGFPLRFLLPMLLLLATVSWARRPDRVVPAVTVGALGALAVVNNVEFGIPAAVGALLAVLLVPAADGRNLRRSVPPLLRVTVGALLGYAVLAAFGLARTGRLPDPAAPLQFAAMFGAGGLGALPMPHVGAHLVIFATFAASLLAGVVLCWTRPDLLPPPIVAGLVLTGMYGLGGSAYFTGRSHPDALLSLIPAWALALAFLSLALWRATVDGRRLPASGLLPGLLVVLHLAALGGALWHVPHPIGEVDRLTDDGGADIYGLERLPAFVAGGVEPDEPVALFTWMSHHIAEQVGVRNVYPFASGESIASKAQVDLAFARIEEAGVRSIFLSRGTHPAIVEEAVRHGFAQGAVDPVSGLGHWWR